MSRSGPRVLVWDHVRAPRSGVASHRTTTLARLRDATADPDSDHARDVERLRSGDTASAGEFKRDRLKCYTVEGSVRFDADGVDAAAVRDLPGVAFACASPGGSGAHAVVLVDGTTRANYAAVHAAAAQRIGLDALCRASGGKWTDRKSYTDVLFLSHDPDAYLADDPEVLTAAELLASRTGGVREAVGALTALGRDMEVLRELARLQPERLDDRALWLEACAAMRGGYGDAAMEPMRAWSAQSDRFDERDWRAGGAWFSLLTPGQRRAGDITMASMQMALDALRGGDSGDDSGDSPQRGIEDLERYMVGADQPPSPAEVVPGALWAGEATILYGDPGQGKTHTAVALAAAADRALWVAHEKRAGTLARLTAARARHAMLVPPDVVLTHTGALLEWAGQMRTLVVIDSFSSAHGDTDSGVNVAEWWSGHVSPWTEAGCAVVVIAHTQKSAERKTPLGSTTISAAADATYLITGVRRGSDSRLKWARGRVDKQNELHTPDKLAAVFVGDVPVLADPRAAEMSARGTDPAAAADALGVKRRMAKRFLDAYAY